MINIRYLARGNHIHRTAELYTLAVIADRTISMFIFVSLARNADVIGIIMTLTGFNGMVE